jgi:hypothetical protein
VRKVVEEEALEVLMTDIEVSGCRSRSFLRHCFPELPLEPRKAYTASYLGTLKLGFFASAIQGIR